jgi:uncharacterized membrane protein
LPPGAATGPLHRRTAAPRDGESRWVVLEKRLTLLRDLSPALAIAPVATDPLERPATPERVRAAAAAAALPAPALHRALRLATATPDAAAWDRFLSFALALLGAGLALAGVVCFVAYNWARVGRFGKFALLEAAIAAAALLAWRKLPALSGQVALGAAAVLVGPLLAVFGQTYQTGADPYGLFLTWLALILPWAVAARFTPLWMVAFVLLDVSVGLYWQQRAHVLVVGNPLALPLVIAALHAAAVATWEWQRRRREPWLREAWAPQAIAVVGFAALLGPAGACVIDAGEAGMAGFLGIVGLGTAIAAVVHFHRAVRPDRLMVTAAVGAGMALVALVAGRVIFGVLKLELSGLLLMSLFVIAEIALGLRWYRGGGPLGPAREA